jgi:hypothetical protein
MKLYLEIIEQLTEEGGFTKQPQIIRIEVKDKNEAMEKLPQFEPFFTERTYIKRLHICNHEDGKPCEAEDLTEKK